LGKKWADAGFFIQPNLKKRHTPIRNERLKTKTPNQCAWDFLFLKRMKAIGWKWCHSEEEHSKKKKKFQKEKEMEK